MGNLPETSNWDKLISYINSKVVGCTIRRQNILGFFQATYIGNPNIRPTEATLDSYRRTLTILGFLTEHSRGAYIFAKTIPLDLTSSVAIRNAAFITSVNRFKTLYLLPNVTIEVYMNDAQQNMKLRTDKNGQIDVERFRGYSIDDINAAFKYLKENKLDPKVYCTSMFLLAGRCIAGNLSEEFHYVCKDSKLLKNHHANTKTRTVVESTILVTWSEGKHFLMESYSYQEKSDTVWGLRAIVPFQEVKVTSGMNTDKIYQKVKAPKVEYVDHTKS